MILEVAGIPQHPINISLLAEGSIRHFYDKMEPAQRQAYGTDIPDKEHEEAKRAMRDAIIPGWMEMDRTTIQKHDRLIGAMKADMSATRRYANFDEARLLMDEWGIKFQLYDSERPKALSADTLLLKVEKDHYQYKDYALAPDTRNSIARATREAMEQV